MLYRIIKYLYYILLLVLLSLGIYIFSNIADSINILNLILYNKLNFT